MNVSMSKLINLNGVASGNGPIVCMALRCIGRSNKSRCLNDLTFFYMRHSSGYIDEHSDVGLANYPSISQLHIVASGVGWLYQH